MLYSLMCSGVKFVQPVAMVTNLILAGTGGSLVDSNDILDHESASNFGRIASAVMRVMRDIIGPIMIVIGAAMAAYMIYLGVTYAKAENADKRKETLGRLIGVGIGLVIILVGIALCFAVNWVEVYANITGHRHKYVSEDGDNFCDFCAEKQESIVHKTT